MTGDPGTPPPPPPSNGASPPGRGADRRRHHAEMLIVSLAVVVAAFVLSVRGGGQTDAVHVAGTDVRLPPLCMSKSLFNVDCPGCGLTRSFVHLAHGDVRRSIDVNRVGWFVALALLVQIPYRLLAIMRHQALPLGVWTPRIVGGAVIGALIGSWLLKQVGV